MDQSPSELTFVAIQAALNAGALLRRGFGTDFEVSSKPGIQNLVTEYDTAAEKGIISAILKSFPDHAILAEESGDIRKGNSRVTWIIDPLDGTVNFAHNIPLFSVSIAAAVGKRSSQAWFFSRSHRSCLSLKKAKGLISTASGFLFPRLRILKPR